MKKISLFLFVCLFSFGQAMASISNVNTSNSVNIKSEQLAQSQQSNKAQQANGEKQLAIDWPF